MKIFMKCINLKMTLLNFKTNFLKIKNICKIAKIINRKIVCMKYKNFQKLTIKFKIKKI